MSVLKSLLGKNTGYAVRASLLSFVPPHKKQGYLSYRCNVCGQACEIRMSELGRESPSCPRCISSTRMRSIIHVLSMELFGQSLALPDFPHRPDIKGAGLSDWEGYAVPLARKLSYTNTFYHKEPRLDITNIDPKSEGTLDFLISTEVFEHVNPPVSIAFENARRLLKPNGVLIFSVPYRTGHGVRTHEHFPRLHRYELLQGPHGRILKNTTTDGNEERFDNLVFHGGEGATLELRVFGEESLHDEFKKAGFQRVKVYREPDFAHGIYWHNPQSIPMSARV